MLGSGKTIKLFCLTAENTRAGEVNIFFRSYPQYRLYFCNGTATDFPTDLPSEREKTWRITLSQVPGVTRVVLHCNNVEVVNVVLSDTTCHTSDWRNYWSLDVEKVRFPENTKPNFYRQGR